MVIWGFERGGRGKEDLRDRGHDRCDGVAWALG